MCPSIIHLLTFSSSLLCAQCWAGPWDLQWARKGLALRIFRLSRGTVMR